MQSKLDTDVEEKCSDSVSMVSFASSTKSRRYASDIGNKVTSSASAVQLKAEVERATLLTNAAALKEKI